MTIRHRGLLLLWYITVFGLAAAASTSVVRADQPARPSVAAQTDAKRASADHVAILAAYGGEYADAPLTKYVAAVGERLAQVAEGAQGFDLQFTVLDSPAVFAFSIAEGNVYLSRGLITVANSEAEVAAVLAHEIAHVTLRHGAERNRLVEQLREVPAQRRDAAVQTLTARQEFDADAQSLVFLAAAGYDPTAQARFLAAVEQAGVLDARIGAGPKAYLDPHEPSVAPRIAKVRALAATLVGSRGGQTWFTGAQDFFAVLDGVAFGRRPAEGMIDGPRYWNTSKGYTFELPAGFQFAAVGNAVTADGPDGASIRVDTLTSQANMAVVDLADYLRTSAAPSLRIEEVTRTDFQGRAMATARAAVVTERGGSAVHLAMVQLDEHTVARFQAFVPASLATVHSERIGKTASTIRPLTANEREACRPLQVRVVTADIDTPAASFAERMKALDHPLEWFAAINQLPVDAVVPAGSPVKLVSP